MASRDLSADLANYASKVQSGQTSQPTTKYNTPQKSEAYRSTRKTGTGTARVYGKPITSGRRKKDEEKDRNYLAETAVEGQSRNAAQQQAAAAEEQKQEQKPQTKYSDEANAKSGGQKQDQNKYSAEANATGPGKKSTSSKTSKPIEDPWDLAENRARVKAQIQKGHRAQAQAYLDEAAALQREGQTRTQIWEDGIYTGEDKQAAEEYSARIADLQAKAQAELDKAGKEEGFRGVKGAAKAVGVNLESGAWQGIMGAGLAGAAKVGQGVSSEDASTLYGRNAAQRSGDIAVNFANQLKNAWSGYTPGDKTLGGRTKDTIFSAFDAGSRAIDSGVLPGGDAAYHATNVFNYALRNWALPNITGSNDAKANAAWLTSKAYEATGKLTDKVAGLGGPLEYLNTEKLQAEMQKSDAAANLAGNTANVIGRMLPSIALSWATKNPKAGLSLMAASAGGSAAEEAYQRGATAEQAYQIGLEKGWVEYLTECMFSGIGLLGNGVLSEGLKGKLGDFMLTRLGMALGKAFDIGGENIEEAVSDWAGPGIDKAVLGYLPEGEEDITLVQAMMGQLPWTEQGLTTLLSTLVLGGFSDIAQNGMQRVSAEDAMEIVEIARNSGNEALANLAERYADLLDKKGSMGAKDYAEFVEATADRVGKEEMQRQLDEKRQRDENPGPTTMTMFSDPATGLNADQLALAKTPDSAAVDILKTTAASWLTAAITGTETGESILGDYISPDFIAQLPEGAQKAALAFANTQFAEEALQNIMGYAAEIVNGNPVDWDDSRSNAAAGYVLGTLSNLFQGGEAVDQKRQQNIAAEAVEFALSGMTIDEAIAAANQSSQKTLTAVPLNVQNAPEGAQAQEGVTGPETAENAAEAGYNQPESKTEGKPKRTIKNRGKGTVSFDGMTIGDQTYKAVDQSKLTRKQKNQIAAVKTLAKATGVNVVFYETETGTNGKLFGANGAYNEGTIYLDVNAGLSEKLPDGSTVGQTAIVRTAAHELTHFIQDFAEEDYNKIKDYIVNKLVAARGVSGLEDLIAEKMARDRTGKLTPERALDEVMADGCEMMLKDSTAIGDLFLSSPNIANKIRGWVNEWAKKVTVAFEGVDAKHTEAKILMESAEELQKMWDDALKKAAAYKAPDSQNVKEQAFATMPGGTMQVPAEQYSLRSMRHDIQEGKMFKDLATYTDMSAEDIDNLRNGLNRIMDAISEHKDILDMNETYGKEDRPFRPFKPNSDPLYTISLDHSTLCTKRLMTQYVIEKLQTSLVDSETGKEGRALTAEEQLAVRDLMKEYAKQEKALKVACAMCYVEAARLKAPAQINSFLRNPEKAMLRYFALKNKEFDASVKAAQADFKESRGYPRNATKSQMKNADVTALNKMSGKLRDAYGDAGHPASEEELEAIRIAKTLPNSTFLTAENLAKLAEDHPLVYKAYASIIRTATRSKALEADMPYYYGDSRAIVNGEEVVSDNFIAGVNAENGMRFSSWSDWQIKHMLDMMTAVIELSTRHCSMHGYTKFLDQVRVFGKTGMMFNMSGVPQGTGLKADGSLDFSPTESVLVKSEDGSEYDAIQAREDYPETAGLQCIGISNEHIRALMASDLIDYIIPYHTSGLNATLRRMAQIANWDDFQPFQNASIDTGIKFDKNVHDKETWHNEPVFSEFFNAARDPANGYVEGEPGVETMRRAADQYKQMCKDRGLRPKFSWANSKVNADFTDDPNYWKLLIDRKMINQKNGELIEQKAVTPNFDFADIEKMIKAEVDAYDPDLQDRALNYVKEHVEELPQRIADLKKSGAVKKAKADAKKSKELSKRFNELQAGVVAAATEGSLKMSERDNWDEGFRANIENSEELTENVRNYLADHGVDPEELEEFGVNYYPSNSRQNLTDADNALAMVSEISETLTGKKQTEAFEMMEGLLQRMDPVDRERYVAGEDPENPAFAKWYNKKHPSLYYKGYKPGDLFWSRKYSAGTWSENQARRREQQKNLELQRQHLQKLLDGNGLAPEDRVSAESFLHEVEEAQNGNVVLYSERDMPEPTNTQYGFKLMNVDENGLPHAMFIDAAKPYELGKWYAAEAPGLDALMAVEPGYAYLVDADDNVEIDSRRPITRSGSSFKGLPGKNLVDRATLDGKRWMTVYKNKAGETSVANVGINGSGGVSTFAMRPGLHAVDIPSMAHIGAKSTKGKGSKIDTRRPNQRWFLIEYPVDNDYNLEAFRNKRKDIRDHLPTGGWYSFQTNSGAEARQHWFITGGMKIVGAVSEADIRKFARDRGFEEDLPWKLGKSYNDDDALDLDNYMRTTTAKPTPSKSEMFDRIVKERNAARKAGKGPQFSDREDYDAAVDEAHNVWAPEFYSKMDQTIQKQMPNKMAANQVIPWLNGKGIKKEEIRWSGIEQFLEGKKSVTKDEIRAFMEGNKLDIETKTLKSGRGPGDTWTAAYYEDLDFDDIRDAEELAWEMASDYDELDPDQLTGWYGEEDGETDSSYIFAAPDKETGELVEVLRLVPKEVDTEGETNWSEYKIEGGGNYREILFKLPELDYTNSASRVHWKHEAEGTIAHARVQDMKTPYGRKVLFVEEIQSDLHNAGAKGGFLSKDGYEFFNLMNKGRLNRSEEEESRYDELSYKLMPSLKKYNEAKEAVASRQYDIDHLTDSLFRRLTDHDYPENSNEYYVALGTIKSEVRKWVAHGVANIDGSHERYLGKMLSDLLTDEEAKSIEEYRELIEKRDAAEKPWHDEYRKLVDASTPDVPFAGSADTYHEYVMKHLLRLAAEGNYDYIGWTTADQQSYRWSDEYEEGYRIEYDQNLPKFMNKYAKQWGVKTGRIDITTRGDDFNYSRYRSGLENVWGVEINDKMKNDVLYVGQPMFSERDVETGGSSGTDVIDILTNPTGESGQLSNNQVDKIVGNPDAFQQFLQATGLQASDIDRSSKSNTRKSVKEAAAQYLADAATARRADELGRQADEWNKAHENDEREEEFDGVSEKNWDRFWNAAHKGYDALVNLIAKDAKNMADYMRIFKDATGEDMSNDPDVLRKQLQDLANDSTADAITGKPLVSPGEINATEGGYNSTETRPAQNGKRLNWNAPGSSSPQTSQYYSGTLTKTGEAVDLDETDYQYVPITERESIRRAAAKVGSDPDQVLKELYGSRVWLSEQVDAAYIIKGYLRSKALATDSKEDWAAYKTFTKLVQERATESGRSLQAFAKQSRPSAGALLDTIEAEVDAIRRDSESRRSRWKVTPEQLAEVEKRGHELATRLAKLEQRYDADIESGMNEKRAWNRVKNDYVKLASEIAAERMVGLISDMDKNEDLRYEIKRGTHQTTTLLEKLLATRDADYIRRYVALSAAGITEDVKYKGKLTADKVSRYVNTLHKQGMLASVPTTLRNLEGNTVFGTVDWAANNVAGAAIDALFGHFTGERTRGMEWGMLDPRVAKAAKDAMIESILETAANIDLYDVPKDAKYGTAGQFSVNPYGNLGSRILLRAEQGLKYALESTDAFFVGASQASAAMAAARANEKAGGSMTEKTAEAIGKEEAMFRTFKNVTPVQTALQVLREFIDLLGFGGEIKYKEMNGKKVPIGRKGGFGLGTFTVPFIGVPVNIAMKSAEYSPLNILLGIRTATQMAQTYEEAQKKGDAELYQKALMLQNAAAGQMGRGAFGSVLVLLLMAAMKRAKKKGEEIYKDWNLEENADVKAQNKAEGKSGQQVNVSLLMRCLFNKGDKDPGGWKNHDLAVNVSANEPMDQFLSMASMLADDDDAPDIMDLVEAAGKGTLDSIMDLSCVASVNEFINTMNYNPVYKTETEEVNGETVEKEVIDKRATRHNAEAAMLAKSASGFIPAAIRHAAAVSDTYQRDTRGDTAVETALNQIISNIPGKRGRESLPVKTDNFGNAITTGDTGTRVANTYLANSYSRVNQSSVSAELERLRNETGDVLLPPRNAPKTVTFGSGKDKTTVRLTADEGRDFHQNGGLDYEQSLRELFNSKAYMQADTDTQEAMVKALKAFSNDTARGGLADDKGIDYNSSYEAARNTDHPTMSVSVRAGYSAAAKEQDWDAVDDMVAAAGKLTSKDREYLKKADNFSFMYDMGQKGTSSSKVNWYQQDLKERIAPTGKSQANGYEIFQTVVDGVNSGELTTKDADNFMNRQQSDGDYYVSKGRHSVYAATRAANYSPQEAYAIWETMDSDDNGKLTKKEVDNYFRKYKVNNAKKVKDEIYKANGFGKYAKKK